MAASALFESKRMADNNDKNRSVLQMLRARAGVSGGLGGYEVARTTVIRCPGCGAIPVEQHGCAACGHAFRPVEPGAGWQRQKDAIDVAEVGGR
ncbi:MAG: hypothetical protein WAV95_01960 [Azonexus sp.]